MRLWLSLRWRCSANLSINKTTLPSGCNNVVFIPFNIFIKFANHQEVIITWTKLMCQGTLRRVQPLNLHATTTLSHHSIRRDRSHRRWRNLYSTYGIAHSLQLSRIYQLCPGSRKALQPLCPGSIKLAQLHIMASTIISLVAKWCGFVSVLAAALWSAVLWAEYSA